MLLIGLVSVGGFTVLAQRRLRSIGMVGALGATDKHIRLVVRANGVVAGVVGTVIGVLLGLLAWLAYRPRVESSAHHVIGAFALPWLVVAVAIVLAVVATFFAAARRPPRHHEDSHRHRFVRKAGSPEAGAPFGLARPSGPRHRVLPALVFGRERGAKPRTPELVLGLAALSRPLSCSLLSA